MSLSDYVMDLPIDMYRYYRGQLGDIATHIRERLDHGVSPARFVAFGDYRWCGGYALSYKGDRDPSAFLTPGLTSLDCLHRAECFEDVLLVYLGFYAIRRALGKGAHVARRTLVDRFTAGSVQASFRSDVIGPNGRPV